MLRILIDLQGCQTESRFRGIGRYTDALSHAIAAEPQGHEIHLLLNAAFADMIAPIKARFKNVVAPEHIHVVQTLMPSAFRDARNEWRNDASCLLREAYIEYIAPDVVFCPSFIEGYIDDSVLSIGRLSTVPVVSTLHDLIPLIWKEQYLGHDQRSDACYYAKLDELKKSTALITISEAASDEAFKHLGFDSSRVVNASEAADSKFRPLQLSEAEVRALRTRFGIDKPFLFYTGGADFRKNLPRLVQAYAALPRSLRDSYQLVFAGQVQPQDVRRLQGEGASKGLRVQDMVFVGYVTDDELVQLYNLAHLFVFPSLQEGFGLPALESMQCGTPVVCSNTSSLPEVVNQPEALFDPLSVSDMTEKMCHALEDPAFYRSLADAGLARGAEFSWDTSAAIALEGITRLIPPAQVGDAGWTATRSRLDACDERLIAALSQLTHTPDTRSKIDVLRLAQTMSNNRIAAEARLRKPIGEAPVTWRLEGPFDSSYSLALVNRELARALATLGHDVTLLSSEGPGDFAPAATFLKANDDLAEMYRRALSQQAVDAAVTSRNMYPPRVWDMVSQANALHNYAWEETGFPPAYVQAFNESLQFLTVTAEHVKKILIDSGVSVPIAVVGNGVDHWTRVQADSTYHVQASGVRLLHVSSCFPRKGADVLLESYGRAFTSTDDVTLIIKTFDNPHNMIDKMLAEMRAKYPAYPSVQIIKDDFSAERLKALYEQCHIMVAPSRAEGFGLPIAEAMLSGLHVIATGWSGQLDFCDTVHCDLIDYRFAAANTHEGVASSVWADPDPEHLSTLMRVAVKRCQQADEPRPAAPAALLARFNWQAVAMRNVAAARELTQTAPVAEPSIGWISTYNTRCGVATYSEHLVSVLGLPVTVLATQSNALIRSDESNVLRPWSEGQAGLTCALQSTIENNDFDVVVIQFNYGFFDFARFNAMLHALADQGRQVVVTLHATIDPPDAPTKAFSMLVSGLARCARLLVHSISDMNRLKDYGLHHNAVLFPHGLLLPENDVSSRGWTMSPADKPLVLASYGFFLPNKGLIELIQACALLKQRGVAVSLRLVNAEYPVYASTELIGKARAEVTALGLAKDVVFTTEFLSDDDSLRLLSEADIVVYPYQRTGESASGAVRYGVASGLPVAVTPLSIFDDVDAAVFRLPGITPAEIADGLQAIATDLRSQSDSVRQKMKAAHAWRNAHAYPILGERLRGMLSGLYRDARRRDQSS